MVIMCCWETPGFWSNKSIFFNLFPCVFGSMGFSMMMWGHTRQTTVIKAKTWSMDSTKQEKMLVAGLLETISKVVHMYLLL